MNKLLPYFFIALGLSSCSMDSKSEHDLIDFIPSNPLIVMKSDDAGSLQEHLSAHMFGHKLSLLFDPLFQTNDRLTQHRNILLSLHLEGKNDLKYMLISKNKPLDSVSLYVTDTITYERTPIFVERDKKTIRFSSQWEGLYFESDSKLLIENSIRLRKKTTSYDPAFVKLYSTTSSPLSLLVHKNAQLIFRSKFKESIPFKLGSLSEWSLFSFEISSQGIVCDIVGLLDNAQPSTSSWIANYQTRLTDLSPFVPITALSFEAYAFNGNMFGQNYEHWRIRNNKSEKHIDSLFLNAQSIGKVKLKLSSAFVSHLQDKEGVLARLDFESHKIQKFRDQKIYSLKTSKEIPLFNDRVQYASLIGDFMVLADKEKTIKEIISHHLTGTTLENERSFDNVKKQLPDQSNLLWVGIQPQFQKHIGSLMTPSLELENETQYPYWIGTGNIDNGVAQLQLSILKDKQSNYSKKVSPSFSFDLDSDIQLPPKAVLNHITNETDWVLQDDSNVLYLISNEGKLFWKKNLSGSINSSIYQVDLYRNGRLQLAYTTRDKFQVLDRNGKKVPPFEKILKEHPTALGVFDYDRNRNYRLLISNGKRLEMRDRKMNNVSGFEKSSLSTSLKSEPKHFRIGSRDYITLIEESGKLHILNRRGNTRIKTPKDLIVKSDVFVHQNGFLVIDDKNRLVRIETSGKTSKKTLPYKTSYAMDASSNNLVLQTENKLDINGRIVELDYGVYDAPGIHLVQNKTFITITDLQAKKVYVFDREGELLPHFPVFGSGPASLGFSLNDQHMSLGVKGDDQQLIVYTIPQ